MPRNSESDLSMLTMTYSRAIPLIPLCAFVAGSRANFTFTFILTMAYLYF